MFYHYKKVKDKENLKLRCLVQVGPDEFLRHHNHCLASKHTELSLVQINKLDWACLTCTVGLSCLTCTVGFVGGQAVSSFAHTVEASGRVDTLPVQTHAAGQTFVSIYEHINSSGTYIQGLEELCCLDFYIPCNYRNYIDERKEQLF